MSSLEIIKQELINQKTILENKGVVVNTANANPSPSEITSALDKINFDFSATTASEDDVRIGKTFYSQTNEIKTGTFDLSEFDAAQAKLRSLIGGVENMEIEIPEGLPRVRNYIYYINENPGTLFYKENLIIPSSVTEIGTYAFRGCNISGTLTIPSTCTSIGNYAFFSTNISELIIEDSAPFTSLYIFSSCSRLKKITIKSGTRIANYIFNKATGLEELYLPNNLETFSYNPIYECTALKLIKFTNETPCTISSNTFYKCPTALLIVPYKSYDAYINTTNFLASGNPVCGYGEFVQDEVLPSSIDNYTVTWYATIDDLNTNTNPLTICSETGTLYGAFTEIIEEETTEDESGDESSQDETNST